MWATIHTTWLGFDHKKFMLVAAGVLVIGIIATITLALSDISGNEAHTSPAGIADVLPMHRPTDRGAGLPLQHSVSQTSAGTDMLEANGLPIAPVEAPNTPAVDRAEQLRRSMPESQARQAASDDDNWITFPNHDGFTDE
jgi:hypothetical protein